MVLNGGGSHERAALQATKTKKLRGLIITQRGRETSLPILDISMRLVLYIAKYIFP